MTASGVGQIAAGLVVIRDDEIDVELARPPRRLVAANAAVDRDDEPHAVGLQPIERLGLQSVAVVHPVRDEMHDRRAKQLERAAKDDGGRDAVAVVVAMNGDALLPLDRRKNPFHRFRHVGKPERIVQMIERRMEKPLRELRRVDPANREQPRDGGADAQLVRQHIGGLIVARHALPQIGNRHQRHSLPTEGSPLPQRTQRKDKEAWKSTITRQSSAARSKFTPRLARACSKVPTHAVLPTSCETLARRGVRGSRCQSFMTDSRSMPATDVDLRVERKRHRGNQGSRRGAAGPSSPTACRICS